MNQFPKTIENGLGEKIIFKELLQEPDGDRLILHGWVQPKSGPPMHVHYKQDEGVTVKKGQISYQVLGGMEQIAREGESVVFTRGTPHRFWNSGTEEARVEGWAKPANNLQFFLSSIYESQSRSGKGQPEKFDGAYLLIRYKSEFNMLEIPGFVRKVIFPLTYLIGRLSGKYDKFKDAPAPLK
jgi:mannose-6-phosphate isomerase-like protein (cupin superfamily)